jgi:hypothetical protein
MVSVQGFLRGFVHLRLLIRASAFLVVLAIGIAPVLQAQSASPSEREKIEALIK